MHAGPESDTHHHHHHTGTRWLDVVLAFSAMAVSIVSLFIAVHHGQTMEKMVEADTWPYVDFGRSTATPENKPAGVLILSNNGVGPARIETFEVRYNGKPVTNKMAFIKEASGDESLARYALTSTVTDRVIPAGSKIDFLAIIPPDPSTQAFTQFRQSLSNVTATICYCSALDECWVRDSESSKPQKVKQCPASRFPYEKWNY
jgi:hypothetical protein